MRVNKFLAHATGLSRRAADVAIEEGRVLVNGRLPSPGYNVLPNDTVELDGKLVADTAADVTIFLHKPPGYVCSRNGQGSKTVYDLLPNNLHHLKPVGRLDKDSSGLLLMTNNGDLANSLTHPRYQKTKVYEVGLLKPLQPLHRQMISDYGVKLEDGPSKLQLTRINHGNNKEWKVTMREGRNRQIRRTFAALDYTVIRLHRLQFGEYSLGSLSPGTFSYDPSGGVDK